MNFVKFVMAAVAASCLAFTASASAQGVAAANSIESISVAQQGGDILVKIDLREPLASPPPGFSVASPARVAFDFAGTGNASGRTNQVVNEGDLKSLNVVQVGDRTRLVLNLVRNMNYSTRLDGKSMYVTLKEMGKATDARSTQATRFAEESVVGVKHAIRDIAFRRGKDGEARIVVDLSDTGTGIDLRQQGSALVVDFLKTTLPENLRRKLDVTDFGTPVTSVVSGPHGENVRMTISPTGLWEHNAYQSDNQFVIEVKKIVEDPHRIGQGSKIGYQGPRVSINYQNGDVRALLRLMAEELGLNAVISETVTGSTTLVLKDVPADQVIDIIFQQKGLDMRKNGNVILIAPRDEIATREKLEYEAKQQIGELEPVRTEIFQVNYHKAETIFNFLKDKSQTMLSKRGSVTVDARTNKLFVSDTPSRLEDVRRVLKEIDIPARQVLIEARIVEASDTFAKNLGVRLGLGQGNNRDISINNRRYGNVTVGGNYENTGQAAGIVQGNPTIQLAQLVNLPAAPRAGTAGALSFFLFNEAKSAFVNLELSALEADGRGKVISSPRVMTADQVEAIIEQGVEIPYQQATSSGATSVSFRKANLSLKVKPQITPDGKLTLSLDINKDEPNVLSTGAIAINTKHVKTEVLIDNGGTIVIGGIYTQMKREDVSKIPFFGDLPVVGWMFRNKGVSDDKNELLVFITPRIVSEKLGLN